MSGVGPYRINTKHAKALARAGQSLRAAQGILGSRRARRTPKRGPRRWALEASPGDQRPAEVLPTTPVGPVQTMKLRPQANFGQLRNFSARAWPRPSPSKGRAGRGIAAFPRAKTAARQFSQNLSAANDNSVLDLAETQKLSIDVSQAHRLGFEACAIKPLIFFTFRLRADRADQLQQCARGRRRHHR